MTTDTDGIEYSDARGGDAVRATNLGDAHGGMTSLANRLLESGVPDDVDTVLQGETNEDHVLGNLEDEELWERRFNIMNNEEFLLAMFPPEESVLQGELRDEFGIPGPKHSLDPSIEHELSDSRDAAYARSTRSRGGFQQEMMIKSIQEQHLVDGELGKEDDGGGLLGFLGGGK